MTESTLHAWLTLALFVMAAITMGLLFVVSAPYGRHARTGWGPAVPWTLSWTVMESPAVVGFAAVFWLGAHRATLVPILLLLLWQVHYVHRAFVYPLRARSAGTPWPLSIVALAFGFQTYNAYLNARWISHFGDYGIEWLTDPRFCGGAIIFCSGLVLNLWSDEKLRTLRKGGETGYRVPRGGAFELVSCPNYLGEILEWIGWACATWSLAGAAFALYTIANLGPRALSHHHWYQERFVDYPAHRKALIPYLL